MSHTNVKMTPYMKTDILSRFYDDLAETRYYCFFSRYTSWGDDEVIPDLTGSLEDTFYAPLRELIYGKRVQQSDAKFMARRHDWASNTAYEMFDDRADLTSLSFFIQTDERKVYKCLYNAAGVPSTSKPTLTANVPFVTGDGYVWKYMYTAAALDLTNHMTEMYYPIVPNTTIQEASVNGAVDVVLVTASGNNWIATHDGSVIEVVANNTFRISNTAPITNNIFLDSGFYVTTGPGAGSLSQIEYSVTNAAGIFVHTRTPLPDVAFSSGYSIAPYVEITGDGTGCLAISTVNTTSAEVTSVQVINSGSGYTQAAVSVQASPSASNTAGSFRAIMGPPGGHGSDASSELFSDRLSLAVKTSNSDSFSANVDFRSAGLMRSPLTPAGLVFDGTEFRGLWTATCNLVSGSIVAFDVDEEIIGQTSETTATVAWANTTHVEFSDVIGTFVSGEVVRGSNSSSFATLTAINSPDIDLTSGQVLFVMNSDQVQRSNTSIEFTRFVLLL